MFGKLMRTDEQVTGAKLEEYRLKPYFMNKQKALV